MTKGILVTRLGGASPLHEAGLRAGDRIVRIDGDPVRDELDLRFAVAAPEFSLDILRRGNERTLDVARPHGSSLDVEFCQEAIRRCTNRCIFCFIDQMPPHLRSGLYIKDEDLTHSFLNGNYVTFAGMRGADLEKILRLGLSPLFVSVHATDQSVRRAMLGNKRAPDIMEQLAFLAAHGIRLHTQIVVCPGVNDGEVLKRTLRDLLSLRDALLSVAVVPVGLTRFRAVPLTPMDATVAREICALVGSVSDRDARRHGSRRVFIADELFLKAGLPIPKAPWYEEFPQIENGVGLVRCLLDSWSSATRAFRRQGPVSRPGKPEKRYFCGTSVSAFPFLAAIAKTASRLRPGITLCVEPIRNRFFGETVTVAGLIAASDVIRALRVATKSGRIDGAVLPSVMFNQEGVTLDGYRVKRIEHAAGIPVTVVDSVGELLNL